MRLTRKLFTLLLALVMVFALVAAGMAAENTSKKAPAKTAQKAPAKKAPANKPAPKKPFRIGAVFDITGPGSSLGVPERDSARMLVDRINAQGGINGHKIELIIYDNESDETKSVLAARKLITQDKVLAFAGASTSGPSLAMIPVAMQARVPMVSAAASRMITEPVEQRKWVFKTAPNDSVVAERAAEYMEANGYKKVAFLSMNNAFGDSGKREFEKVAKEYGLEIVVEEKFEATDKDMTAQLTKVKAANPDAVLVWAIPPSASIVTKNYRQLGISAPLIHSHGIGNRTFIELAGDAANGVIFPIGKLLTAEMLPKGDVQKSVLVNYAKEYESKFGPRSTFGGHGYDAVALILEALKRSGDNPTPAKIRDELEKIQNYPGISGIFNFSPADHSGLDKDDLVMVKIQGGKWKLIK